jgi:hypothetical protein
MSNEVTIASLGTASALADADLFPVSQGGVVKGATLAQVLAKAVLEADELSATWAFSSLAAGTKVLVLNNRRIGTIVGADLRMTSGSCTVSFQIADQDGSNATDITDLASLSATTTLLEAAASAANIMAKTGTSDRQLQMVIASPSGTGELLVSMRYKVS